MEVLGDKMTQLNITDNNNSNNNCGNVDSQSSNNKLNQSKNGRRNNNRNRRPRKKKDEVEEKRKDNNQENRIEEKQRTKPHHNNNNNNNNNNKDKNNLKNKQDSGNANKSNKKNKRRSKFVNTTDFKPNFDNPSIRIRPLSKNKAVKDVTVNDVFLINELFCDEDDYSIYEALLKELQDAAGEGVYCLWHGDTHLIANDNFEKGKWKASCPTFQRVVKKIEEHFNMKINATRFNWYRDAESDFKPYHFDRAAFTPNCPQNFTVAASFGRERQVGFEKASDKSATIHLPVANGSCYTFSRDVNIEYRHAVIPMQKQEFDDNIKGRISIICWGKVDMDCKGSRITENECPTAKELGL